MKEKTLLSYKGLSAVLTKEADDNIVDLLSNTVLGSKGGMRYGLQSIPSRIAAYKDIRFVSLYKNNKLTGTVGLCYRKISQGDLSLHGTYLRYLAVKSRFQSEEDIGKRKLRKDDPASSDTMKGRILSFFRNPHLLDLPGYEEGDKNVVYAYVESRNERSKNIIHQVGFQHIRSFLTVAFSRFSPKVDPRTGKLKESERPEILNLLSDYYKNYSFYTDESTFFEDRYYVIRSEGKIVAGLSAVPTTYNIVDVPSLWGWIFMHVLPFTPLYRRLFKPGIFRFLVFGSIYVKPGHEKDLESLMESVCASEKINTGLTWMDDRSDLFEMMRGDINMGALNRMLNARPGLVYANFINLEEEEKEFFYEKPAFISGFDFT